MIACMSHVFVIFSGETFDNRESFPYVLTFEYESQSLSPSKLLSYMVTTVYIRSCLYSFPTELNVPNKSVKRPTVARF